MSELNHVIESHNNTSKNKSFREVFENHAKLHFYLALDKVLFYDLIGQTVDFKQILTTLKQNYPDTYTEVIERSKQICSVLD
jgi:pyoverdine/dityrosine biosynthesis protein Dit1